MGRRNGGEKEQRNIVDGIWKRREELRERERERELYK